MKYLFWAFLILGAVLFVYASGFSRGYQDGFVDGVLGCSMSHGDIQPEDARSIHEKAVGI